MSFFSTRQACAVESAARWHPHLRVFVLFASPTGFLNESVSPTIKALQKYPNIYFRNVNIWKFAVGTPGDEFIQSEQLFRSKYLVAHMSDFLRYIAMFRYGGFYFDLDVIVLKSLDHYPPSFAGAEDEEVVATGVMAYRSSIGDEIIAKIIRWNLKNPNEFTHSMRMK